MPGNSQLDALIGKIYDTSLTPGDWVELLFTIASWVDGHADTPAPGVNVDQLVSHLERAVRGSAYIHALEDRGRMLNSMYHQMPWPMLVLDDQMQVLEYNPAAQRALAEGPVQLLAEGQLHFSDGELRRALKRASSLQGGRQMQLLNSSRDTLTLLCLPVEKSDAPGPVARIRTIVWMLSGHRAGMPSPEMLQAVFHITQAESRLLHQLCKLGNLQQSAARLSISVHTARSQLKSTMSKLNVSSQVQLVSQAMRHTLVQATQPDQAHPDNEYTTILPDGRVLSWYEYGDPRGRPLLTLDNLGSALPDHALFEDWYRQQGLRVILVVRPGYGLSSARCDMEFRHLGPDLRALCTHLHLCRPSMAAYCGGAPHALCTAALEPDLFDRLGLLATTVPPEYFEPDKLDPIHAMFLHLFRKDPRLFVLVGRLALHGVQRAPEKYLQRLSESLCASDRQVLNDPDLLARLIRRLRQSHFQGARIVIDEYLRLQQPWVVNLRRITVPVLMWHGEEDRVISVGSAQALARDIPGAHFRALPGQGRFLIYQVWRDFLTELLALPPSAPGLR